MKNILVIVGLSVLMSCHQSSESVSDLVKEENYASMTVGEIAEKTQSHSLRTPKKSTQDQSSKLMDNTADISKAQKLIKNGRISVDVEDLRAAKAELDAMINSLDGYYESESFQGGYNTNEYHLAIRVPNVGFDQLTERLDGAIGQIVSKEINTRDVTEEYVDLGIRLESKLAALAAYRQFLKRATNVEEILNVQREIRQLEEEIEAKKGRLRFLDDQVAYSTLRINLIQHIAVVAKAETRHFGTQIKNAFVSGYDGILNFVIAMAYVWPLWIVLGLIAVFLWRKRKKVVII